jgi:DnaJ-domain-containing protein 1
MRTYYALLGVQPTAGLDEIRRAYRRMARQFHPDRHADLTGDAREDLNQRMAEINEAWMVLGDRHRRAQYDLRIAGVSHLVEEPPWEPPPIPEGFDLFPKRRFRPFTARRPDHPESRRYGYRFADESHRALSLEALTGDLSGLDAASPDIAWLVAARCPEVNDDQLRHVVRLTGLRTLDLSGASVTDLGIGLLASLTDLLELNLLGTPITDAAMRPISRLSKLQSLGLAETPLTDDGLSQLSTLTNLIRLDLRGTRIARHCVEQLSRLPRLGEVHLPLRISWRARGRAWRTLQHAIR